MMQIIGFVLVLALVYVVKSVAILKTHENLADNSASFSWTQMHEADVEAAQAWAEEGQHVSSETRVTFNPMRHAGGFSA